MPMYPDTQAAIDRIRAMQKGFVPPEPQAGTDVGPLDTEQFQQLAPMDMPTEAQINTPVYGTGNETFGMGPQQSLSAPDAPSKRDRIAAALQMRRQMGAGAKSHSRPFGG